MNESIKTGPYDDDKTNDIINNAFASINVYFDFVNSFSGPRNPLFYEDPYNNAFVISFYNYLGDLSQTLVNDPANFTNVITDPSTQANVTSLMLKGLNSYRNYANDLLTSTTDAPTTIAS